MHLKKYFHSLFSAFKQNFSTTKTCQILSQSETIDLIIQNRYSISRFGDGEISLMLEIGHPVFQKTDKKLKKRLNNIFLSHSKNILICLADEYNQNFKRNEYWTKHYQAIWPKLSQKISIKYAYGSATITRNAQNIPRIKKIWEGRDIVIVEGEKSRLGVGNDLFDNATSIKRILCPANNAFKAYHRILKECKKYPKSSVFLIALGPTATVLSYDLAKYGYQALDIGHIDIVYEWSKMGPGKHIVPGKYVDEVAGGEIVGECSDPKYLNEIAVKI